MVAGRMRELTAVVTLIAFFGVATGCFRSHAIKPEEATKLNDADVTRVDAQSSAGDTATGTVSEIIRFRQPDGTVVEAEMPIDLIVVTKDGETRDFYHPVIVKFDGDTFDVGGRNDSKTYEIDNVKEVKISNKTKVKSARFLGATGLLAGGATAVILLLVLN